MNNDLAAFKESFNRVVTGAQRFCYMTRAAEIQKASLDEVLEIANGANELKQEAILVEDEDKANQLLCFQKIANAVANELKMWLALKDDRMNDAWQFLVRAQAATRSAMQAHRMADHLENYAERLYALEKLIFPPLLFQSVGAIIKKASCSICGEDYDRCEHIVGRPYMGEICGRYIEECELEEISLVPEPANKLCRITTMDGRDVLTWRPMDEMVET